MSWGVTHCHQWKVCLSADFVPVFPRHCSPQWCCFIMCFYHFIPNVFHCTRREMKRKMQRQEGGNLGTVRLCDRHPKGEENKTFRKFCATTAQPQDHPTAGKKWEILRATEHWLFTVDQRSKLFSTGVSVIVTHWQNSVFTGPQAPLSHLCSGLILVCWGCNENRIISWAVSNPAFSSSSACMLASLLAWALVCAFVAYTRVLEGIRWLLSNILCA